MRGIRIALYCQQPALFSFSPAEVSLQQIQLKGAGRRVRCGACSVHALLTASQPGHETQRRVPPATLQDRCVPFAAGSGLRKGSRHHPSPLTSRRPACSLAGLRPSPRAQSKPDEALRDGLRAPAAGGAGLQASACVNPHRPRPCTPPARAGGLAWCHTVSEHRGPAACHSSHKPGRLLASRLPAAPSPPPASQRGAPPPHGSRRDAAGGAASHQGGGRRQGLSGERHKGQRGGRLLRHAGGRRPDCVQRQG